LLWFGAVRVLDGATSLGTMLAMTALAVAFLTPLASVATNVQRLQVAGAHLERIAHVLEAAPEQQPQSGEQVAHVSGRIELENVGFRYDLQAPLVLSDISVSIEPGQKVALVGRTGSGKSTLAMLLLGLYPPTSGEIRYARRSLQSLNYRALRRQFGVVLQDASLIRSQGEH
jgi:ABC-type bacteriocin/lantibiotic exporter with double-glycine peptidase domain